MKAVKDWPMSGTSSAGGMVRQSWAEIFTSSPIRSLRCQQTGNKQSYDFQSCTSWWSQEPRTTRNRVPSGPSYSSYRNLVRLTEAKGLPSPSGLSWRGTRAVSVGHGGSGGELETQRIERKRVGHVEVTKEREATEERDPGRQKVKRGGRRQAIVSEAGGVYEAAQGSGSAPLAKMDRVGPQ